MENTNQFLAQIRASESSRLSIRAFLDNTREQVDLTFRLAGYALQQMKQWSKLASIVSTCRAMMEADHLRFTRDLAVISLEKFLAELGGLHEEDKRVLVEIFKNDLKLLKIETGDE